MKNWFKTLWLTSEERQRLKENREVKPVVAQDESYSYQEVEKPYKNIYFSNGNLTVIFKDGTVISKSGVDHALFSLIKGTTSQELIENLLVQKLVEPEPVQKQMFETREERKLVSDNLEVLKHNKEFEIKGNDVYLKGVNLAIPASVIASFIEILENLDLSLGISSARRLELEEQFQALKMFWLKLALNTLPQSREDLLTFVRKNDVRITRNGNLILYRRIVTKAGTDIALVTFVSQEYYRIKKAGFVTRDYAVGKDGDVYFLANLTVDNPQSVISKLIGNLQVMYLELPNYETNTFTAWHGRNTDIRIGGIYKIEESGINLNNSICAAGGLHAAAVDYNYSGFGDLPVVVLVNPSKAITVPIGETGKLRTTEMFIACVNDKEQGIHFDESALGAFDEEYHDLSLNELEEAARTKSFEKLSVVDTVPAVSLVDLNTIRNMLKTRVKEI